MVGLKERLIALLVFTAALTPFGCAHKAPTTDTDAEVEIWQLELTGQTRGKLQMTLGRIETEKDIYSVTGKISGEINDQIGGSGSADYKLVGKIENDVLTLRFNGHSQMAEGSSSVIGTMRGSISKLQGSGTWKVVHALGSSTGQYTMKKTASSQP